MSPRQRRATIVSHAPLARLLSRRTIHRTGIPGINRDAKGLEEQVDALVLGQEPVHPLTIVEARAIGVMRMRDEKGLDDKIVAVSVHDPAFADYTDHAQLPSHILREIRHFFQDYKVLEHKQVAIEDLLGPVDALRIIREALSLYQQLRRGELKQV